MKILCKKSFSSGKDVVRFTFVQQKESLDEFIVERGKKVLRMHAPDGQLFRRSYISLIRRMVVAAKKHRIKKFSLSLKELKLSKDISFFEAGTLFAENALMADFEFTHFKTSPKKDAHRVEEIIVVDVEDSAFSTGVSRGLVVGEEVNGARVLSNTPGGDMTPTVLGKRAKEIARSLPIRVTVLGKREIERHKMGAILGVAKGSKEEPKFIILEYRKGGPKEKPVVLIGKGVTFDTGGLNLKPTGSISDMHLDMSGGAAVIHAIVVAARLKLKKNIVGLIPAVENMPSGESYRPGDILKSMSGKTIEVLNTDAEGRLILSDALTFAKRYTPKLVVDVATLTGAALVALGQRASALFTKEKELESKFLKLGEESGDYLWPLPLWEEYEEDIKGNFADLANIPPNGSNYGGAINGATFLYQFVKDKKSKPLYPWAHIDIAPRMTSIPSDLLAKGAAGAPVRLLVKLLESH